MIVREIAHEELAVRLHFPRSTWRFRLSAYLRGLRRPRAFLPLLLVATFPAMLDRVVVLLVPSGGMFGTFLAMGLVGALLILACTAMVTLLVASPPTTITLDARGVQEEVGGRVAQHTWGWITDVVEDADAITLYCHVPMRSLRLAPSARARHLLVARSLPEFEILRALLQTQGRLPPGPGPRP